MPAALPDLALLCLACAVVGGWVVWVAVPFVVDAVRRNILMSLLFWPAVLAVIWPILRPVIHAITG